MYFLPCHVVVAVFLQDRFYSPFCPLESYSFQFMDVTSPSKSQLEELICRCNHLERTVRDQENTAEMFADAQAECRRLESVVHLQDETISILENKLSQFDEEQRLLSSQANSDISTLRSLQTEVNLLAVERDTAKRKLASSEAEVEALMAENVKLVEAVNKRENAIKDASTLIAQLQAQIDMFENEDMSAFFTRTGKRDNAKHHSNSGGTTISSNDEVSKRPQQEEVVEEVIKPTPHAEPTPEPTRQEFQSPSSVGSPLHASPPPEDHIPTNSNDDIIPDRKPSEQHQLEEHPSTFMKSSARSSVASRKDTPPAGSAFLTVRQRRKEQQIRASTCIIPPNHVRGVYGERGQKGTESHQLLITYNKIVDIATGSLIPYDLEGEPGTEVMVAEDWVPFDRVDENCESFQEWRLSCLQGTGSIKQKSEDPDNNEL